MGYTKKDFITGSCVYSNIAVVGKKENIQRIADSLQEMQTVMREIAGQVQSGNFPLSEEDYQELMRDYLALVVTVVDIVDGAAYLFDKEAPTKRRNWKAELELEQLRRVLETEEKGNIIISIMRKINTIFYCLYSWIPGRSETFTF